MGIERFDDHVSVFYADVDRNDREPLGIVGVGRFWIRVVVYRISGSHVAPIYEGRTPPLRRIILKYRAVTETTSYPFSLTVWPREPV